MRQLSLAMVSRHWRQVDRPDEARPAARARDTRRCSRPRRASRSSHSRRSIASSDAQKRFEKRLRPHERAARYVEPVRHLSAIVGVRVRTTLTETEITASDPLFTSAALRAAARGSFDDVRHRRDTDLSRGRSVIVPVLSRPHARRHGLIRSVRQTPGRARQSQPPPQASVQPSARTVKPLACVS